jgi:DNA recombination protein RmuC
MDAVDIVLIILSSSMVLLTIAILSVVLFKRRKNDEEIKRQVEYVTKEFSENSFSKIIEMNKQIADLQMKVDSSINKLKEETLKILNDDKSELTALFDKYKSDTSASIAKSYTSLFELVDNKYKDMDDMLKSSLKSGFDVNTKSVEKVAEALGRISEAQKNLDSLDDEVKNLNSMLNNSQKRGRFGEIALESILNDVFGNNKKLYDLQHVFYDNSNNKQVPDAVIFLPSPENMLCIDSKFPFQSYEKLFVDKENGEADKKDFYKNIKDKIKKIADSYIVEGKTCRYAIMFIPSDAIYSYIQSDPDLYKSVELARKSNVVLASPSTLEPMLANLRMLTVNYEISRNVDKVIDELKVLATYSEELSKSRNEFNSTFNTLTTKKSKMDTSLNKVYSQTKYLVEEIDEKKNDPQD